MSGGGLRGICPTTKCDTVTRLRNDGKVRKHRGNAFCDGEPREPHTSDVLDGKFTRMEPVQNGSDLGGGGPRG